MKYLPQMENIGSEIQDKVISEMENYDPNKYTANDVLEALKHDNITPEDFKALLSPAALPLLEQIAQKAQLESILVIQFICLHLCILPIIAITTVFTVVSTAITKYIEQS